MGIFSAFLSSTDIIQNELFRRILSGIRSECQPVWIQIRPDVLSGQIWVQTVFKSYQQTTVGVRGLLHHEYAISTKTDWANTYNSIICSRRMAENGFAPPPREFCRHILSCRELKAKSFKRCLHSVLRGVSL